jgi:hypothetical protein
MVSDIPYLASLRYKLTLIEEDWDQQDIFFVAHTLFITPLDVLERLIRIYDEECHDIRAR